MLRVLLKTRKEEINAMALECHQTPTTCTRIAGRFDSTAPPLPMRTTIDDLMYDPSIGKTTAHHDMSSAAALTGSIAWDKCLRKLRDFACGQHLFHFSFLA
jgi:hypothetical protein